IESVSHVINRNRGSRQLLFAFRGPRQRIQSRIQGTRGTTAMVQIDGAQTDDRAEPSFPCEAWELHGHIGIVGKFQSLRAWSLLVLIDHELTDKSDRVIA